MNILSISKAIFKAVFWIFIGVFFGIATFVSVFASSYIFKNPNTSVLEVIYRNNEFSYDYSMFLCVCLMAGAAADFSCSANKSWSGRVVPIGVSFLAVIVLFYLFNPALQYHPSKGVLKGFMFFYMIGAFLFCMSIKTHLFYVESKQ